MFVLVGSFINKHFYYPVCSLTVKHQALSFSFGLIPHIEFNAFLSLQWLNFRDEGQQSIRIIFKTTVFPFIATLPLSDQSLTE